MGSPWGEVGREPGEIHSIPDDRNGSSRRHSLDLGCVRFRHSQASVEVTVALAFRPQCFGGLPPNSHLSPPWSRLIAHAANENALDVVRVQYARWGRQTYEGICYLHVVTMDHVIVPFLHGLPNMRNEPGMAVPRPRVWKGIEGITDEPTDPIQTRLLPDPYCLYRQMRNGVLKIGQSNLISDLPGGRYERYFLDPAYFS